MQERKCYPLSILELEGCNYYNNWKDVAYSGLLYYGYFKMSMYHIVSIPGPVCSKIP